MDGLGAQGGVVGPLVCGAAVANAAAIGCRCFLFIFASRLQGNELFAKGQRKTWDCNEGRGKIVYEICAR